MASVDLLEKSLAGEDEDGKERALKAYKEIISTLPKVQAWSDSNYIWEYQGFWIPFEGLLEGYMWMQQKFKPRPQDILLVTYPKSGTTWFKSLLLSITNRTHFDYLSTTHPLLNSSPHDLVPHLEFYLHQNIPFPDTPTDSDKIFHTHIPFSSFSQSMIDSQCRIVYVCRNPKDVFVSLFFFCQGLGDKSTPPYSLEKLFELFCEGVSPLGPFWDHVLGYWKASLELPETVMFVKYEDMMRESSFHLKRMAAFVGCPFSAEEERNGVVDGIVEMCSFENLKNLKANKTGAVTVGDISFEKHTFFRKSEVGDWKRHLTAAMAQRLDDVVQQKLAGSGLTFFDSAETS